MTSVCRFRSAISVGSLLVGAVVLLTITAGHGATPLPHLPNHPSALAPHQTPPASVSKTSVAHDLYGDPLPEGAIARIGTFRLRHSGLSDVVALPDGETVLTAGTDRVLRYWSLKSGAPICTLALQGNADPSRRITLSPDGKWLAAIVTRNNKWCLVIWDVATGHEIKCPREAEHTDASLFLTFSPDGNTLAVGSGSAQATLWDWQTGRERVVPIPERQGGWGGTFHACFSPDGRRLSVGGGTAGPLYVFDVASLKQLHRVQCFPSASTVSPDGKVLAVSCEKDAAGDPTLRLLDLETGKEQTRFDLPNARRLTFSPDGKTLAHWSWYGSSLVDLPTGRVRHRLPGRSWTAMAYTPDGNALVAVGEDDRLRVYDPTTGRERHDRPGDFGWSWWYPPVAISPDGRILAASDIQTGTIDLWNLAEGSRARQLPLKKGDGRIVSDLTFSVDGETITATQPDGLVQSWDVRTGAERLLTDLSVHDPVKPHGFFAYSHIRVTSDSRLVSLDGPDKGSTRLAIWDTVTGRLTVRRMLSGTVSEWTWASDGSVVAVAVPDVLLVISGETGRTRLRLPDADPTGVCAISPDGRLVAALRRAKDAGSAMVGVWEVATGREVAIVPTGPIRHLALAADGRTLVAVGDGLLRVWDLASGRERGQRPLASIARDPKRPATGLLLTPDVSRAFTPLADGTGLVWNLTAFPSEPFAKGVGEKEMVRGWAELASDASFGYTAIWRLVEVEPGLLVRYFQTRLKPVVGPDPKVIRQLVTDLGSDDFPTREAAQSRLATLGPLVAAELQGVAKEDESPEVRRRAGELLDKMADPIPKGEPLRCIRAIAVLERIGTAEARKVLGELAGGAVGARETEEAKAALARLAAHATRP